MASQDLKHKGSEGDRVPSIYTGLNLAKTDVVGHKIRMSDEPLSKKISGKEVQGPVVQSIVSLTSSLRGQLVKCFLILYPNTLIFLLKKYEKLLPCKSFSHFFNKKYQCILDIYV